MKVVPYKHTEPMELPSDSCPSDSRVEWALGIAKYQGEVTVLLRDFEKVTYGIFNDCDGTDPTETYLYTCGDKVVVCFCSGVSDPRREDDVCYSNFES